MHSGQHEGGEGQSLARIVNFSDGVFAIAITLLILNVQVPDLPATASDADIRQAIFDSLPRILVYLLSFAVIGLFWFGHHRLFHYIRRFDRQLMYLNLLFLLCITFLPYPTAILGSFQPRVTTVMFYAGSLAVASLAKWVMWEYAVSNHRLVDESLDPQVARRLRYINASAVTIFVVSMIIALYDPQISMYTWNLLWVSQVVFRG